MGLTTQTKEIDGLGFTVTQLPGMRGVRMLVRLTKLVGSPLAKAGVKGAGEGELLAQACGDILDRLSPEDVEAVARELLETALVRTEDGHERPLMPQFDLVMQGRTSTVLRLVMFALEVNYGNFFGALAAQLATGAAAMTASVSRGSSTSPTSGLRGVS